MGKHQPVQIIRPGALRVYSRIRSKKYRSVRKSMPRRLRPRLTQLERLKCLPNYPSTVTFNRWSRRNISRRRPVRLTQLLEKSVSQYLDRLSISCNYNACTTVFLSQRLSHGHNRLQDFYTLALLQECFVFTTYSPLGTAGITAQLCPA